MASRYVAHVFPKPFRNGASRSNYYWYHHSFHIPHTLNFYCKVFIFQIFSASFLITLLLFLSLLFYFPVRTFRNVTAGIRFSELDITFFYVLQYTITKLKFHEVGKYYFFFFFCVATEQIGPWTPLLRFLNQNTHTYLET